MIFRQQFGTGDGRTGILQSGTILENDFALMLHRVSSNRGLLDEEP